MNIKVSHCNECPFVLTRLELRGLTFSCGLSKHLMRPHINIKFLPPHKCKEKVIAPKWCPLKKEEVNINFKFKKMKRNE